MADDGFRPATEGAGNEILKAVNEIYDKLTGEEEDAHPHTLPEADEGDNKGIWLTEETARKIVESLGILASKIEDRKDNTFTVNQNGVSTEYNTYAAKSISVPVPSAAGEEGQALVTSKGGETSEWSNEIGGVTLKEGDISAEGITASGEIEAKGGITVSDGDLEVSNGAISASGKVTAGNGLGVTGDISASGNVSASGDLEAKDITASGTLDVTGKATLKGGLEVSGGTETDSLTTNGVSVEKDASGKGGDVTVEGTLTVEDKATLNGGIKTADIEASGTVKGSFEGDLEGNAKTATTAEDLTGVLSISHGGTGKTSLTTIYKVTCSLSVSEDAGVKVDGKTLTMSASVTAYGTSNASDLSSFVENKLNTSKGAVYDLPITGRIYLDGAYIGGLTALRFYLYDLYETSGADPKTPDSYCNMAVAALYSTTDNFQNVAKICDVEGIAIYESGGYDDAKEQAIRRALAVAVPSGFSCNTFGRFI